MLSTSHTSEQAPPQYQFTLERLTKEFGFYPIKEWINWDVIERYPKLRAHVLPLIDRVIAGEFLKKSDLEPPPTLFRSITGLGSNQQSTVSKIIHHSVMDLKENVPPPKVDPNYATSPTRDIPLYISRWTEPYRHYVTHLAGQLPPMHPRCRTVVAIPAAAHEEGEYLIDTLKAFKNQTETSDLYEIAVFLNCPAECTPEEAERAATLSKMVSSYIQENPSQPIVCMRGTIAGRRIQSIGFIRSILTDALIVRGSLSAPATDLIQIRCDADTRGVTDRYIENFRKCFDTSPNTDAFIGRLRWSPEHTFSNPLSFVNQRLAELVSVIRHSLAALPSAAGPVFAIRSSVFAAIGGYSFQNQTGEDVAIGERALAFRKGSKTFLARDDAGPASRLYTSSRRADAALHLNAPLYHQWERFETSFGIVNTSIRSCSPSESLAPKIENTEQLQKTLEEIINKSISSFEMDRSCDTSMLVEKLISAGIEQFLGIQISRDPSGRLKIDSLAKFLTFFAEYRQNGLERWRKSLSR